MQPWSALVVHACLCIPINICGELFNILRLILTVAFINI